MSDPVDDEGFARVVRDMCRSATSEEMAFYRALGCKPGNVGMDDEGRLQVRRDDGTWAVLVETEERVGELVLRAGTQWRLLLLMEFDTGDDCEALPAAEEIDTAVDLYRHRWREKHGAG